MKESLEERLKYTQPHNIDVPPWLNEWQADYYRQYEHNRQKHEARYRAKYMRSKWSKRQYGDG